MLLGQEVHYYMVYIAYFTELILQICDYAQKRRICRENCKYALDGNFHCHFCSRRKAAKFCHPAWDDDGFQQIDVLDVEMKIGFSQSYCFKNKKCDYRYISLYARVYSSRASKRWEKRGSWLLNRFTSKSRGKEMASSTACCQDWQRASLEMWYFS